VIFIGDKKHLKGRPAIHGMSSHPVYCTWNDMMQRCYNMKRASYHRYGGRGIKVCTEWHSPKIFIEWAISNGWVHGLELDRKNNDSDYMPDNCRFITPQMNSNNRRDNLMVCIEGRYMTFSEAVRLYGKVKYETARRRFQVYGWSLDEAITNPPREWRR
jgi:hypothetical protein